MKIEARAVSVAYGEQQAVRQVSLAAEPGQMLVIVGPNGSGKSSLIKAMAGLVPMTGVCLFDDSPTRPDTLAYMPQDISASAVLSVLETVLLGRLRNLSIRVGDDDLAAASEALALLGLLPLAQRPVMELSGGQRQMVFLAQALAARPRAILLDEPISALDIRHQLQVMAELRRLSRERAITIIAILHDLSMAARHADRIALLGEGVLMASGPPSDVLTRENIKSAFHVDAIIGRTDGGDMFILPKNWA